MTKVKPAVGQNSLSLQINKMGRAKAGAARSAYPKNQPVQFPL